MDMQQKIEERVLLNEDKNAVRDTILQSRKLSLDL